MILDLKLNGLDCCQLIQTLQAPINASVFTKSVCVNSGHISFSKNSASGAHTLKINIEPTLPKIVFDKSKFHHNHSCLS